MDITNHINNIISENRFNVRSKKHPDACPCYKDKPCHDMSDLNCFLCYCPNYDTTTKSGGCKISNPCGKWYYNELLPDKKVWDCSDCTYPHKDYVVKEYLIKTFNNNKKEENK